MHCVRDLGGLALRRIDLGEEVQGLGYWAGKHGKPREMGAEIELEADRVAYS